MEQARNLNDLEDIPEPRSKFAGYKVNKKLALVLALEEKSYREIADHFGVTKSAISQLLAEDKEYIDEYIAFKHDPALAYEFREARLLSHLDEGKIKTMTGRDLAVSAAIFRDKVRLERGQATSINATATFELTEAGYKDLIASKYTQPQDLLIGNQQPTTQQTVAAQGKAALPKAQGDGPGDGPPAKRARAAKHAAARKPAARKAGQP